MGLTLIAIFSAALLLPGIIAARAFYFAGQTREVEVPVPSLSTPDGIALVGFFSLLTHALYIALLSAAMSYPYESGLPPANPYLAFNPPGALFALQVAGRFATGLILLSLLAGLTGLVAGRLAIKLLGTSTFYGPLGDVIESGKGDDKFITAYVLSKISHEGRIVGYQGTVDSMVRDENRYPSKVILRDVVPFYLSLADPAPTRTESDQIIDRLVLSADEWHNVAFKVFQVIDDEEAPGGL